MDLLKQVHSLALRRLIQENAGKLAAKTWASTGPDLASSAAGRPHVAGNVLYLKNADVLLVD